MQSRSVEEKRVLGVEGGGTKTEWALLGSAGEVIARGLLPAANLRLIDDEALKRLLRVLPAEITHVGVFLAGCVDDADRARLSAMVARIWPQACVAVGSDRESGFASAFGDGDGIMVIAGTGSAVTGRRAGRVEKAGGWGQLLGDRGGGYNLAVQALRLVLSQYDLEQRVDELGQSILRTLCLSRLEDLVRWATSADKMAVANLAPVVFEAARNGHEAMQRAIEDGARIHAQFTGAVARRLALTAPEVRLSGGLYQYHPEYGELFAKFLSPILPEARTELCTVSGALGAAWLADRDVRERAAATHVPDAALADLATATTEQRNPRSAQLEKLPTPELVELFVTEESHVAGALARASEQLVAAVEVTADALQRGGRLFYVGAGTSGRLGVLDASEIPPTFGVPPHLVQGIIAGGASALYSAVEGAEDQAEAGALAIIERGVAAGDVVCGISASGRTPFVLGALGQARQLGARTILLTCNPARRRGDPRWDVEIDLETRPEILTGSTRLKAGTATKVALNIISTCAMIRLGKVHDNLMVDLNVSNEKLRERAVRVVADVHSCSRAEARSRLEATNWNVRAALGD